MGTPQHDPSSSQPGLSQEQTGVSRYGDHPPPPQDVDDQGFPETPNLHMPLIPDDSDSWGDEYRHTLDILDKHPGIASVEALPEDPYEDQVVIYGDQVHRYNAAGEWEVVGLSRDDSRALEAARALLASIDVRLASLDAKDYATQATLAQAAATIQDLLDRVGAPAIEGDTVLAALRDIHRAVDGLELSLDITADTLNLNTDDLEELLQEISAKVLTVEQLRAEPLRTASTETSFVYGVAAQVSPGETQTVSTMVGGERLRVVGFSATGEGDGTFRLFIDGAPVASGQINVTRPHFVLSLPASLPVRDGATAEVVISARGEGVSDYEATIYGEMAHG